MIKFDARAYERELVAAGYMPTSEYVRRWGENKDEVLSWRAAYSVGAPATWNLSNDMWERLVAGAAGPKANTGERAND